LGIIVTRFFHYQSFRKTIDSGKEAVADEFYTSPLRAGPEGVKSLFDYRYFEATLTYAPQMLVARAIPVRW